MTKFCFQLRKVILPIIFPNSALSLSDTAAYFLTQSSVSYLCRKIWL